MKQFKLAFPESKAWDFANWCHTNEIKVALSWLQSGEFFEKAKIHVICQASDAGVESVKQSEWKAYLITN